MTLLSPFSYLFLNPFYLTTFCLLFLLHFPFCDQSYQGVYPRVAFQEFAQHYYSFCITSTDLLKYKDIFNSSIKLLFKLTQNEDHIFFFFFFLLKITLCLNNFLTLSPRIHLLCRSVKDKTTRTLLVVQWLRIYLAMQGTQV